MTELLTTGLASAATVDALSSRRNDPAWVRKARLDAWAIYQRTPMPTINDELWRRTDISLLKLDRLQAVLDLVTPARAVDELPDGMRGLLDVGEAEAAG